MWCHPSSKKGSRDDIVGECYFLALRFAGFLFAFVFAVVFFTAFLAFVLRTVFFFAAGFLLTVVFS